MTSRVGDDDDTFVIEEQKTFRIRTLDTGKTKKYLVAAFVVNPVFEIAVYCDRDAPSDPSRIVTVCYEWRDAQEIGRRAFIEIAVPRTADFGRLLARHAPDVIGHLSVRSATQLATAVAALSPFTFVQFNRFRQTGWRTDGTFAFPLAEDDEANDVDLRHLGAAGASLLGFPPTADAARALDGAATWLRIAHAAPVATAGTVLGTILAAPMYRREDHLGARGLMTLIVAPTGEGKTTFASRAYSVVGRFHRPPQTLESWTSTGAALESVCHAVRDLPALIDDYRDLDGSSRDTFRTVTMAVGNAAARGRARVGTHGELRVAAPLPPRCLIVGTAETAPEGDAGEAARILVVGADGVDVADLLALASVDLATLPHLYMQFIEWLGGRDTAFWSALRDERRATQLALAGDQSGRVAENLSLVYCSWLAFLDFVRQAFATVPAIVDGWAMFVDAYAAALPEIARAQSARVSDETLDGLFLNELARGIRAGDIIVPHVGQGQWRPSGPPIVGYYDDHHVYLRTELAADWASRRLQSARRRKTPLSAKALVQALLRRGGTTGTKVHRKIGASREKYRLVERAHLGEGWYGLLGEPANVAAELLS